MTTLGYARPARERARRRLVQPAAPVLATYIPSSTADLWKSAKRQFNR